MIYNVRYFEAGKLVARKMELSDTPRVGELVVTGQWGHWRRVTDVLWSEAEVVIVLTPTEVDLDEKRECQL